MGTAHHLEDRSSEAEEVPEHMASFRWESTGVDNTIFLSPKGYARHAARIKVSHDVTVVTASVAVHDGSLVDVKMPPALLRRVQRQEPPNSGVKLPMAHSRKPRNSETVA
jgi:hypothetical protein